MRGNDNEQKRSLWSRLPWPMRAVLVMAGLFSTADYWSSGRVANGAREWYTYFATLKDRKPTDGFSDAALALDKEMSDVDGWKETKWKPASDTKVLKKDQVSVYRSQDSFQAWFGDDDVSELLSRREVEHLSKQAAFIQAHLKRERNKALAWKIAAQHNKLNEPIVLNGIKECACPDGGKCECGPSCECDACLVKKAKGKPKITDDELAEVARFLK